jgi:hydroxyacylglutathione hydrolase
MIHPAIQLNNVNVYILPVTPFQQNCSIIHCTQTNEAAIVDPGGEIEYIIEYMQAIDKNITAKYVLLTHGHLDHCGQALKASNMLGVPIYGPHKDDLFWLEKLEEQSKNYYKAYNFELATFFEPHKWLNEGDILDLGIHKIDMLHIDGHTPGHLVFYIKASKIAWVGDVIFKHGVGRSDFPRGNTQKLMHNIVHKLLPLGDDYTFICGHGETSSFGHERMHNPHILQYLAS